MTAAAIIEEIKSLPPEGQSEIIRFAIEFAQKRQLSGEELGKLADQLAGCEDPAKAARLKLEIVRGFYGE